MMDITYGIIEEIYILGDKRRTSYGIAAYSNLESDSTVTIVASVRDISCDKQKISNLVTLCNRLSLSPIHLGDVVVDFYEQ